MKQNQTKHYGDSPKLNGDNFTTNIKNKNLHYKTMKIISKNYGDSQLKTT